MLKKIFGSRNDRILKEYRKIVEQINKLEPKFQTLTDDELKAKTAEFKTRHQSGESLDKLLPEAFATVREASKRVMGMRHFDVQLLGGIALHQGKIGEMRTGEGKTLTATLAVYLNAISGDGVHVITVNNYLAHRDATTMSKLYNWLGMSVGINLTDLPAEIKFKAYRTDITYGTNNEFGFDYLRDNMVMSPAECVQRPLNFAIIDEVDSVLIDEARTPLIISGAAEDNQAIYSGIEALVHQLKKQIGEENIKTGSGVIEPGDFVVDEKNHQIHLTEDGYAHAEEILVNAGILDPEDSLYESGNVNLVHHIQVALKANHLFHLNQHYVIKEGEIVIVDEFTGRMMDGRRWGDGLHQAVEAKEGVAIQAENQTMASITFQNYFRLYKKLAGMTGTADTEAAEFEHIYGMETVVIPPHRAIQRIDHTDRIYKTAAEKYDAVISLIIDRQAAGQPVLVGTSSIENSEVVSELLKAKGVAHEVLNAKNHFREADIIAQAGRSGAITIATNMAGRGTDIVLGGNIEKTLAGIDANVQLSEEEKTSTKAELKAAWQADHDKVTALGGLFVIGTERHDSRRIDNQLRGRCGRQGDPGVSAFFLSLDDQLMRIFAGDKVRTLMERLNMPKGQAIESGLVNNAIESAQRQVEAHNFNMRKDLLDYDDVASTQRKSMYGQRNQFLHTTNLKEAIQGWRESSLMDLIEFHVSEGSMEEQWDLKTLQTKLQTVYGLPIDVMTWYQSHDTGLAQDVATYIVDFANNEYQRKTDMIGTDNLVDFERMVLLQSIDRHWRDHLQALAHLKEFIHLRGYAQKQPKDEFKKDAFQMFSNMLDAIRDDVTATTTSFKIEFEQAQEEEIVL